MQRKSIEVCVAYLNEGTLMNCVNGPFLVAGKRCEPAAVSAAGP
jgi:hypothetical protein